MSYRHFLRILMISLGIIITDSSRHE